MKLVIIGLGTAGFAAALTARKIDRTASITIVDEKDFDLLHNCGLPFYLEGKIKDLQDLKHDLNLKQMRVEKIKDKAVNIDTKNKEVITKNDKKIKYDKLIITTGASPFIPPIEGKELAYTLHTAEDAEKIKKLKGKKAVIVGASAIGLETAVALNKKGFTITVIDMLPSAFPRAIDVDISTILENYLTKKGIKLLFNKTIEKIEKDNVIINGKKIKSDVVIFATGVRANIDLAKKANIKIGEGGILVDEKMQTNIKDIYAAGDCVQVKSLINNKEWLSQIATSAYRQGIIVGTNATGSSLTYEGALTTFVSVIGEIELAATGFNSFFADFYGYKTITGKAKSKNKPDWFPGGKEITLKILADKKTGKIIGAQAIGSGATERINILSTAIKAGFTLKDLSNLELAYCPAISQHYDVILQAADLALRKFKK